MVNGSKALKIRPANFENNNTIKAGGSTKRAQNVGVDGWSGWTGYPLDCYDYQSTFGANNG